MELKPGYKQTEVGVIPEDWAVRSFGEIFNYLSTATNSRSDLDDGGDTYYIHYGDIHTRFHNHLDFTTTHPPRIARNRCRNAALLKNGDWVMADASEDYDGVGKTIEIQGLDDDTAAISGLHTFVLREKIPTFASGFKGHLGNLKDLHEQYLRVATGMKVYGVSKAALRDLPLPIPTFAEQEAIAEALSDADALIDSLEQLIAKKRLLKQGAMQDLLTGNRRLPGFEGESRMQETEVGRIPLDWTTSTLGSLVDPNRGIRYGIVQPGVYDPSGRFMIRGQDYSESKGWAKPSEVFKVSDAIEHRYRNARVREGDLIMTIVGYCGHVETIPQWLDGANLTQTTTRIAIRSEKANASFCKYQLQTPVGTRQVASYIKGAAQPGLNCGDVEEFLLCLPSLAEQTAIAAILSDMDANIVALEAKLAKARQVKQGMMQELLTGKTRLV